MSLSRTQRCQWQTPFSISQFNCIIIVFTSGISMAMHHRPSATVRTMQRWRWRKLCWNWSINKLPNKWMTHRPTWCMWKRPSHPFIVIQIPVIYPLFIKMTRNMQFRWAVLILMNIMWPICVWSLMVSVGRNSPFIMLAQSESIIWGCSRSLSGECPWQ